MADAHKTLSKAASVVLIAALIGLAAWPLRDALREAAVPGAGPDVVSTLWGMWWLSVVGPVTAMGGMTDLVNYPYGAIGAVLSPSSGLLWSALAPLIGPAHAAAAAAVLQSAGLAGGTALLVARLGGGMQGAMAAGVATLSSRYLPFGIGEGSAVAVAAIPIPLGVIALLSAAQGRLSGALMAGLMMAWAAAENPYLAPVLPAIAGVMLLDALRRRARKAPGGLAAALLVGIIGVLLVAEAFGRSASPDYPREVAGITVELLGRPWEVVDLPWARAGLRELLWPGEVRWTLQADAATAATGGRYLGLAALMLSAVAAVLRPRAALPWLALTAAGVLLALGSVQGSLAGPFLFLNALMDALARPLTQPTRFLALAVLGLSTCSGLAVGALAQRRALLGAAAIGLLLADGLLLGGLSLRLPTTPLPTAGCLADLDDGGLLLWPYDADDGELSTVQLYQIRHQHPSPQTGIASWALSEEGRAYNRLRGGGWTVDPTRQRLNLHRITDMGYRWGVIDTAAEPSAAWMEPSLGEPVATCGDLVIYDLVAALPRHRPKQGGRGQKQGVVPEGR